MAVVPTTRTSLVRPRCSRANARYPGTVAKIAAEGDAGAHQRPSRVERRAEPATNAAAASTPSCPRISTSRSRPPPRPQDWRRRALLRVEMPKPRQSTWSPPAPDGPIQPSTRECCRGAGDAQPRHQVDGSLGTSDGPCQPVVMRRRRDEANQIERRLLDGLFDRRIGTGGKIGGAGVPAMPRSAASRSSRSTPYCRIGLT